jgi:hypothetical protein
MAFYRTGAVAYTALAIAVLLLAAGAYRFFHGWPPVIRNGAYRSFISDFGRATRQAPTPRPGEQRSEWNFDVQLPNGVVANVTCRDFMDVAKVKYSDERERRRIYKYVDYSNPMSLRTNGTTLYVYWGETLFHTDYWLLAFDLATRKEARRRKVAWRDMPPMEMK